MNNPYLPFFLFLFLSPFLQAQPDYTAHDTIPAYTSPFRYGANMGAYYYWTDQQLADIAAGNPGLGVEGVGVDALRPLLSEWFLEYWGYDIRLDAFAHYEKLGIRDNVVFVGYPSDIHRDETSYCEGVQSELFANLYEPVWDNGENGTPVNEENYYASYLWKMVSLYHEYVKIWEIWNEPDFDFVGKSSLPEDDPESWWNTDPEPCEYAIHAPVQHYIRMLRISYEVIKTIAPEDYVALGGIGYPSFLDALLRNTDNPAGGMVDSLYPLTGGAYFDVVSYHTYPHIDNSLRAWSDEVGGFVYFRHSDKCIDGLLQRKKDMQEVLDQYGYNDETFPSKEWIITESNIPRVQVGEFLGSNEAQRNYLIKALVACQKEGIGQFHVYQLGDIRVPGTFNEFHTMGLFAPLDSVPQYEQQVMDAGIAYGTTSMLLKGKYYDEVQTSLMKLPENIRGAAFRDEEMDAYTYVLWAVTDTDRSEEAFAEYSFPASFNLQGLHQREWDFSRRGITKYTNAGSVELTGAPRFFTDNRLEKPVEPVSRIGMESRPNPFSHTLNIRLELPGPQVCSLSLYDGKGRMVYQVFSGVRLAAGYHTIPVDGANLSAGVYVLYVESHSGQRATQMVVRR